MIEMRAVNKTYPTRSGPARVLKDVDLTVDMGERVGILGRNGAGKSTMIRLISGAELPTSGTITRDMSVSWPLAFGGAFQGALTGWDNLRFICRVYGVDWRDKKAYVEDFSELGIYLREPVKSYSSGMRARLAFAISMVIEFDCFLIDEIIAVGDARFHQKCNHELFDKRGERAMIIVSHEPGYIREHCNRAAVLHQGSLVHFDNVDDAYDFYTKASLTAVAA
ncbi:MULTISPECIES: ABC transporter ATP-binding protein [Sphingomonas]|uniref:ABC transporter ATP-binding protein n=1 Tax=Sphingomonas TaxID=13687 RepID=UPI000DEFDC8C|nr:MULTISPECIES: ABC transporter ATP-binding protein [Sphingomonas]